MERAEILTQSQITDYAERKQALNEAVDQLLRKIFVCSHRQLTRPFTRQGKTYRTCLNCGMHRDFDLRTWRSFGPYYSGK